MGHRRQIETIFQMGSSNQPEAQPLTSGIIQASPTLLNNYPIVLSQPHNGEGGDPLLHGTPIKNNYQPFPCVGYGYDLPQRN